MSGMVWLELKKWLLDLQSIDESVTSPEMIKRLDLSGRSLEILPESFSLLTSLISLNLSGNHLRHLSDSFGKLTQLSNLDIRRNQFEDIPPILASLSLSALNASGNRIEDMQIVSHCETLRVLDLSVNALTSVENGFAKENRLRSVNLSCNYIKNVTHMFSVLSDTERLDLSGNMINQIPESIGYMENLTDLNLSDNVIEYMDDRLFDLGIETLELSSNKLYWIRLEGLEDLENIVLDFNPIKHIEISDDFAPYLEHFSCDGCGLKSFVPIRSQALKELCYSSNEIKVVPEYIGQYVNLLELDLDGNMIVDLPDSMANLTALSTLYIDGNPLSQKAQSIVEILHPEICDIRMKTGITIDNATKDDLEEMAHLLSILFAIEQDFTIDFDKQLEGITKLFQSEGKDLLVAKHEGQVVGMVTMQRLISSAEGDYIGQIEDLVVKEDYRKMGVGSRLINKMRAIAQEYGYKRIQLAADEDNANALQFYSRRGFHQTHLKIYHYNA